MVAERARRLLAFLLPAAVLAAAGCQTAAPPDPARLAALDRDLGQLLMVGIEGTGPADAPDAARLVCEARVGTVLLFARNVRDAEQVAALTAWLRQTARACAAPPLLLAVDAEGGRVMRLGAAAGYSQTLGAHDLGESNDLALAELEARRIGRRLRQAGIDWNLAPVVDVAVNPANPTVVAPGRSFGINPDAVAALAGAWATGMRAEGLLTTLKHFPGHGSSLTDSHHGFVDVTDTARLDLELAPYRTLLGRGLADAVMTAHVLNRHLDARHPTTLSAPTIDGLLRRELGFAGVVVTDDLRMGAIE